MLGGPLLPILLLAIPFAFGVIVLLVGIASWLRPSSNLPRATVVKTQSVRNER